MDQAQEPLTPSDFSNIANRAWQQNGLGLFIQHLEQPSDFAVYACPGAGKTRFAIAAAQAAIRSKKVDCVIIVAPQSNVVTRWRTDFGVLAGIDVRQPSGAPGLLSEIASGPAKNLVLTYSALGKASGDVSTAGLLNLICTQCRVMVILDEVHHMAEQLSWGEAARVAFENAVVRMHLSGTPFRSDDQLIPWLMEATEVGFRVRQPDVSYTYAEAVVDQVCRPIFGHRMVADVRTEINGQPLLIDLNSVSNEAHARAALDVATDIETAPEYAFAAIRHGYERLQRIRSEEQPNAGMMIIARNVSNAEAAAALFRELSGSVATVAHSGDPGAAARLEGFRNSTEPCLINVKMASEGYDAQRIRVIVFLTNVRTELNWLQTLGRAIRREEPASRHDRQDAHVFFPPVPPLQDYMLRMTTEATDWIIENRPEYEGLRPVIDEESIDVSQERRRRREIQHHDIMRPEARNVRRDGVILEKHQIHEDLCAFVAEVAPFLPRAISILSPERLAREYLDDREMRKVINMFARHEGVIIPAIRPEDMR